MRGRGDGVELYDVRDCDTCVAACSRAVKAVFVDYCDGGGAVGSGSGRKEGGG